MVDKYKLQQQDIQSMDLNTTTLDKLRQLLPEVFTENHAGNLQIDIEKLKIALGGAVDIEEDNQTRYSFLWSGKKQAQLEANKPTTATLRPCVAESKNWDNTENVYIEGDNLEVLKLLQKSYYDKIKMIYIDPPYNTGKDFVYKDNYRDNMTNYLQLTGQVDDSGNRVNTNSDTSGRYHTDWLNMMYPRLKLARNLLKDDGVIFISIDDNEVHNLCKICDEIFGEDNYLETFYMQVRYANKSLNEDSDFQPVMEHVLLYAKNKTNFIPKKSSEAYDLSKFIYSFEELTCGETLSLGNKTVTIFKSGEWKCHKHDSGSAELLKETWASGSIVKQGGTAAEFLAKYLIDRKQIDGLSVLYKIHNMGEDGLGYRYVTGPLKEEAIRGKFYSGVPLERLQDVKMGTAIKYKPISNYYDYSAEFGNIRNEGSVSFNSGKKPIKMLKQLMNLSNIGENDIILDFFSGSATTAHAVMQLNAEDDGKRKYICVQLPETTKEDSEAYKAGYKNICEIGKERIRRAGDKVLAEFKTKQQPNDLLVNDLVVPSVPDIGFKVFKLDTSNIKPFNNDDLLNLDLCVENRTSLDLFYELVIKQGYTLEHKQSIIDVGGTKCYALLNMDNVPFVLAVLDDMVKDSFATAILKYPLSLVVVKDSCFSSDEIKLNALATLDQLQTSGNKLLHCNDLQIRII
jgi:adenine-specific DNA-methyltransferase